MVEMAQHTKITVDKPKSLFAVTTLVFIGISDVNKALGHIHLSSKINLYRHSETKREHIATMGDICDDIVHTTDAVSEPATSCNVLQRLTQPCNDFIKLIASVGFIAPSTST